MIEKISMNIATVIFEQKQLNRLDYLKTKLGLEILLINLTKGLLVYGVALVVGTLFQTLVTHLAYSLMRRVSFGLHAKSSLNCTLISLIMFVAIPFLAQNVVINNFIVTPIFIICIACFYRFAPASTEKNPLVGAKRRKRLKTQSVLFCAGIMVFVLLIPFPMVKVLMTLGVIMQTIWILPITYKILKRSRKSYEQYEIENMESIAE